MYVKTFLFPFCLMIMLMTSLLAVAQSNDPPFDRGAGPPHTAIDVQISLYTDPNDLTYPRGDGDGNTQALIPSEQDQYEIIIQHFADAIIELTGGQHKVRNVVINTNGIRSEVSDVVWVKEGQPNVNFTGSGSPPHGVLLAVSGCPSHLPHTHGRVVMSDIFLKGDHGADMDFLASDLGMQRAGYVLAQRFVQYYYVLFDEWKRFPEDVAVDGSLMSDPYQTSNAFSFSIDGDGLSPWTSLEHTDATMQHRRYHSSASATLRRHPYNDPKYPFEMMFSRRSVPSPPKIHNPSFDIDITWRSPQRSLLGGEDMMFVLDVSGGLGAERMANLINSMKFMGNRAFQKGSNIGVISFGTNPVEIWPYRKIQSDQEMANFETAMDGIVGGGDSNMKQALELALSRVASSSVDISYVVLVSDGEASDNPLEVVSGYATADIPIVSIFYPPGNIDLMTQLASSTGGFMILTGGNLSELEIDFYTIQRNPTDSMQLTKHVYPAGMNTINQTIYLPTLAPGFDLSIANKGPANALTAVLISSTNQVHVPTSSFAGSQYSFQTYMITPPDPGEWTLEIKRTALAGEVEVRAEFTPGKHEPNLAVESLYGDVLRYPTPMVLQASISAGDNLHGVPTMTGSLVAPSGATESIVFKDDGVLPDPIAGDGDYTVSVDYSESGEYLVLLEANGRTGTHVQTNQGSVLAPAIGFLSSESPAVVAPVPWTEPFDRTTEWSLIVIDARPDDHSADFLSASGVALGNLEQPGRFETIDDVDYFTFNTGNFDTATVRITNIGENLSDYHILISGLGPGGLFDIWGGTFEQRIAESPTGYLFNNFEVFPHTNYYIQMTNRSNKTTHTNYLVSAGSLLLNEIDLNPDILDGSGGGGGGGGCLIAAVTNGTPFADELGPIRSFRDTFLLSNAYGSEMAAAYYRFSPYWIEKIHEHSALKLILLGFSVPIIIATKHSVLIFTLLLMIWWNRKSKISKYKEP